MSIACEIAMPLADRTTRSGACTGSTLALDNPEVRLARTPKVLVIDDSGAVYELLLLCLGQQGLEVATIRSAAEARAVLARDHFDLVILDWTRPGTECPELPPLCKARHPDTPVIIITNAGPEEPHLIGVLAHGADAVIPRKGFLNTLSTIISRNFDRRPIRSLNAA